MKTCSFFGHHDSPESIKPILRQTLIDLIENNNVSRFLVGHHGSFDRMALSVLREIAKTQQISYGVVLSFLPNEKNRIRIDCWEETLIPRGLEKVPPKYGIIFRNKWMVNEADIVIGYMEHPFGGAAKFLMHAEKMGKKIIYLKK